MWANVSESIMLNLIKYLNYEKTFLLVLVVTFTTDICAQLVLDSLGRVGIGNSNPRTLLSIGGNVPSSLASSMAALLTSDKTYGAYVWNTNNSTTATYAGNFRIQNDTGNAYAIRGMAQGRGSGGAYQTVIGIRGTAGFTDNAVGVMGSLYSSLEPPTNFAGIYGSESSGLPTFATPGKYAGYFYGKVRVTNGIYATVLSPTASSSSSEAIGTSILSEREESVTDRLSKVQTLQFLRYDPTEETRISKSSLGSIDVKDMSPEQLDSLDEAMGGTEPERYLSSVQYGLAADQLKEVYPELVYEDESGNVSINYVEMVPLLVQSINELSRKVAELEGTSRRKSKAQQTAMEESVADIDVVRMDQNSPNPFSESTVITLNIPSETQTACMLVYDMNGKQVQNLPVTARGETDITVHASALTAGMYIYTLVVDGKAAVTRRMIVTE